MNRVLGSHPWIPSTVVTLPELHVPTNESDIEICTTRGNSFRYSNRFPPQFKPYGCNREEGHSGVKGFAIHGVEEKASLLRVDERPKALGLLDHLGL